MFGYWKRHYNAMEMYANDLQAEVVGLQIEKLVIRELLEKAKDQAVQLENTILSKDRTIKSQQTHMKNIGAAINILMDVGDGKFIVNGRITVDSTGRCTYDLLDNDFPLGESFK